VHQRAGIRHRRLYLSAQASRTAWRHADRRLREKAANLCRQGRDRVRPRRIRPPVKKLEPLSQETAAFKAVPNLARRDAIWVKPKLVAQINFTEWTGGNSLRHPSYQGLREDKPATQVVREKRKRLYPKSKGPIKLLG
jgi:hypothetical protein